MAAGQPRGDREGGLGGQALLCHLGPGLSCETGQKLQSLFCEVFMA